MLDTKDKTGSAHCPECEIGPFTRNHYFTGKLLVERDFRQEQDYYVDKLRLHAQRLHGQGVVCGLKVTQHDNPACRDRFVCVEPGLAIDCCGHDILVAERDCLDLTQLDAMKALTAKKDDRTPHTLQICVRYRECPTEQIPVLYDDCGCDDTQCAPNRILESYAVDVMVDAVAAAPSPQAPGLVWKTPPINVAHASHVALHDATRRLYIMTEDNPGFVYAVSTDNYALLSSHALGQHGLGLTVSNDGTRVYAIVEGSGAANPRQLHVLDATKPGLPLVQPAPLDMPVASAGSAVALAIAPAPDNRLLALVIATGDLLRWNTDIDTVAAPAPPATISTFSQNQNSLVLGTDGTRAYAAGFGNQIQTLVLATPPLGAINVLPAASAPSAMAVLSSPSGDLLAVADQAGQKLYLVDPAAPTLIGTLPLDHGPIAIAIAPDGRWAYVVEQDTGGKSYVEAVDLASLRQGKAVPPSKALPLGANSAAPVLNASGKELYVPFVGNLGVGTDGGVAIVDVTETACCELFWRSLEGCPDCNTANCVVLTTIKNYVPGDTIEDQTDPPADPVTDAANHVARIDNREGRHLLPSTETLAQVLNCLCATGAAGKGLKGDPGAKGDPGPKGDPGHGLEQGLTRIKALSWKHNLGSNFITVKRRGADDTPGIAIGFTDKVHVNNLIDAKHVFQVLVVSSSAADQKRGLLCRCPVVGKVIPVDFTDDGHGLVTSASELPPGVAPGVAFLIEGRLSELFKSGNELWVVLRGDYVIDVNGKAVDAEFVRGQLPTGDRLGKLPLPPAANPFSFQGGTFESWFTFEN